MKQTIKLSSLQKEDPVLVKNPEDGTSKLYTRPVDGYYTQHYKEFGASNYYAETRSKNSYNIGKKSTLSMLVRLCDKEGILEINNINKKYKTSYLLKIDKEKLIYHNKPKSISKSETSSNDINPNENLYFWEYEEPIHYPNSKKESLDYSKLELYYKDHYDINHANHNDFDKGYYSKNAVRPKYLDFYLNKEWGIGFISKIPNNWEFSEVRFSKAKAKDITLGLDNILVSKEVFESMYDDVIPFIVFPSLSMKNLSNQDNSSFMEIDSMLSNINKEIAKGCVAIKPASEDSKEGGRVIFYKNPYDAEYDDPMCSMPLDKFLEQELDNRALTKSLSIKRIIISKESSETQTDGETESKEEEKKEEEKELVIDKKPVIARRGSDIDLSDMESIQKSFGRLDLLELRLKLVESKMKAKMSGLDLEINKLNTTFLEIKGELFKDLSEMASTLNEETRFLKEAINHSQIEGYHQDDGFVNPIGEAPDYMGTTDV